MMHFTLYVLILVEFSLTEEGRSSREAYCAHFTFPNMTGRTLTVKEHSKMIVAFKIKNSCDDNPLNHTTITIGKLFGRYEIVCYFEHPRGRCEEKYDQPYCECPMGELGDYGLEVPVDRSSDGMWKWSASDSDEIEETTVKLVVSYSPKIKELIFWNKGSSVNTPVSQNSSVIIHCSWDNGVPPVTSFLVLLDHHDHMLQRIDSSDQNVQMNYTISSVQCEDAGVITCEDEKKATRKNRTLLVECAPNISSPSIALSPEKDLNLAFPVRCHTTNITECFLRKVQDQASGTPAKRDLVLDQPCNNSLRLKGLPPNMTLYLNFTDVTTEQEGSWQLELANDVGVGRLVFNISFSADTARESPDGINTPALGSFEFATAPFGIVLISVNSCIIMAIIIIAVKLRSRGRTIVPPINSSLQLVPLTERPLPHQPVEPHAREAAPIKIPQPEIDDADEDCSGHTYEEVQNNQSQVGRGTNILALTPSRPRPVDSEHSVLVAGLSMHSGPPDRHGHPVPRAKTSCAVAKGATRATAKRKPQRTPIGEDETYLHPVASTVDLTQIQDQSATDEKHLIRLRRPAYNPESQPVCSVNENCDFSWNIVDHVARPDHQQMYEDDGYIQPDPAYVPPTKAAPVDESFYENTAI